MLNHMAYPAGSERMRPEGETGRKGSRIPGRGHELGLV